MELSNLRIAAIVSPEIGEKTVILVSCLFPGILPQTILRQTNYSGIKLHYNIKL